ncbi:MAG TPA: recombinase family protein [Urbifossiella sp.]|nr:recombinase family protein [Urbifossiella sp.]
MTTIDPIAVALYARASSDEQQSSCGDQLVALRAYCQKQGYKVWKEYVDNGLSGSKEIEKRIAYHEMIADSYKHAFTRIIVWDSSRFGRLDSQKGATYKVTLRSNGVTCIETCTGAVTDWSTQMGRLQDALASEADHEYSMKLSANTIRGRVSALIDRKVYPHGIVPYGYKKKYRDAAGREYVYDRDVPFRQPRGWTRELIISEPEAAVVRDIFDRFVNRSQSARHISKLLSSDDYSWRRQTVLNLLRCKAYIGYAVISEKNRQEAHRHIPYTEVPGVVPPIIEEAVWFDAQRILAGTTKSKWRSDQQKTLSGILRCGHCGFALAGRNWQKEKTPRTRYVCTSSNRQGTGCPQWRCYEDELLPVIVRELVKVVDAELLNSLVASRDEGESALVVAQQEFADLREKVRRAVTRAATADDELVEDYEAVARDLRQQLKAAEERMKLARMVGKEGGSAQWAEWWADVRPGLVLAADDPTLADELAEAVRRHPAFASVRGQGGFDEFKQKARRELVRIAPDGNPDPVLAILQQLLNEESEGVVLDSATLKGVLRRLACVVSVYWRLNPGRTMMRQPKWYVDKVTVSFGGNSDGGCGGGGEGGGSGGDGRGCGVQGSQCCLQSSKCGESAQTAAPTERRGSRKRTAKNGLPSRVVRGVFSTSCAKKSAC